MHSLAMLVYKDLTQQRTRLLLGCAMLIVFSIQMIFNEDAGIVSVAGVLGGLTFVSALGVAYDEDQGGLAYLRSLPLTLWEIIGGKYLSTLAIAVIYGIFGIVPALLFGGHSSQWDVLITGVTMASGTSLLLSGAMLAMFFRYGYRAIQLYIVYFWLGLIGLGFTLQLMRRYVFPGAQPPAWMLMWLGRIDVWFDGPFWRSILVIMVVISVLYMVLAWLAERNLRHRDV